MEGPDVAEPVERILLIRPSALGDVCRSVPVLTSLRRFFPDAHIAWLVRDAFAEAVEAHPDLNEVIEFPRTRFGRASRSIRGWGELWRWLIGLRRRRFDLVIDAQGLLRSGIFARVAGAKQRIGHANAREGAWMLYTDRVPAQRGQHTVDRMLSLVEAAGAPIVKDMRLYAPESARAWWTGEMETRGIEPGTYAVLAPTAAWASKRWPIERWAELLGPLQDRGFERVVVIGAPGERDQVAALVDHESATARATAQIVVGEAAGGPGVGLIDMVGKTSVGQTMAVIEHAGLVIANDSAPLHMAVGFDRPLIALFGPTDPNLVGPYERSDAVIRPRLTTEEAQVGYRERGLGDRVMRRIEVGEVVDRLEALFPNN
jgi:heptosyltransferase-1